MAKIQNDLNGWLIVDKPYGIGSTQVVSKLKWLLHPKKIGHAGTLDPLATGVLPIALGKATKTIPYVMDGLKTYRFKVRWGAQTTTDDAEGEVVASTTQRPTLAQIQAILPALTGDILQTPPLYSAIKTNGVRAYELARRGQSVEMKPRPVFVRSLKIVSVFADDQKSESQENEVSEQQETMFEVTCGKGTYVRSLAHDMGEMLGCKGYVTLLRRTKCGPFDVKNTILLANMEKNDYNTNTLSIIPVSTALGDIPVLAVHRNQAAELIQGKFLRAAAFACMPAQESKNVFQAVSDGHVIALVKLENGLIKPFRVLETY
ncbi:MAG: tRNA pseudouridine(55) synthase TruB [Alphaproteobacteria bacterium]